MGVLARVIRSCCLIAIFSVAGCDRGRSDRAATDATVQAGASRERPRDAPSGVRSLGEATDLIWTAAFDPQRLINAPPMQAPPDHQANLRALLPCFRQIREGYERQLPQLLTNLHVLQANMQRHGLTGEPPPGQPVDDALNYIRVMHIVETAIGDPSNLAQSPDFTKQRNAMAAAGALIQSMDPGYRELTQKGLNDYVPVAKDSYRQFLQSQCQWDSN